MNQIIFSHLQHLMSWVVFYNMTYIIFGSECEYVKILPGALQHLMNWIACYDLHFLLS
jgi:hypothetical protein